MMNLNIKTTGIKEGTKLTGHIGDLLYETTVTKADVDNGYVVWPPEQENTAQDGLKALFMKGPQ